MGELELELPHLATGRNQPSKPTEPKATGSIKLKVQYEAIPPPVLKLLEDFERRQVRVQPCSNVF